MPKKKPARAVPAVAPAVPRPGLRGDRLKAARIYRGFANQRDFADSIVPRVYQSRISNIENNASTERSLKVEFLERIWRALNPPGSTEIVTLDYLFGHTERMTRPADEL